MKICPACSTVYHEDAPVCPYDGASLLDLQADDARCGTVIDECYLVISQLGAGGMGTVYRAWQFSTARLVALKLLHAELGAHKNATERFMREARITAHRPDSRESEPRPPGLYVARAGPQRAGRAAVGFVRPVGDALRDARGRAAVRGHERHAVAARTGRAAQPQGALPGSTSRPRPGNRSARSQCSPNMGWGRIERSSSSGPTRHKHASRQKPAGP